VGRGLRGVTVAVTATAIGKGSRYGGTGGGVLAEVPLVAPEVPREEEVVVLLGKEQALQDVPVVGSVHRRDRGEGLAVDLVLRVGARRRGGRVEGTSPVGGGEGGGVRRGPLSASWLLPSRNWGSLKRQHDRDVVT